MRRSPNRWLRTAALGICLLALGGAPAPVVRPLCEEEGAGRLRPSPDLYCMDLVPRPEVPEVRGVIELGRAESPYDIAVTASGSQRYAATLVVDNLPEPSSLGPYTAYVAWVTPPSLDPMRKVGVVKNGRTPIGEINDDKFLVFITAEASADVTERAGRLVLRGMSPSIRMQQHSMLMLAGSPDTSDMAHHGHHGHAVGGDTVPAAQWFMPPENPRLPMVPMPGVDELVPPATPYLPGTGLNARRLPEARPRQLLKLADGDTLELTASLVRRTINGRTLVMFAYNGQYPGPLLQVAENATVMVRFRNALDQPSAVHWHGIRLENRSDGVPGVTQDPVPAGGEYLYRVHFKDAGIYWYHSHFREDIQQDLGLYGNILVHPKRPDAFGPVHREETLLLDDLLLGDQGLVPYGAEHATHALMGRFGNVFLVNGETDYSLEARPGEIVRFYLTNASNTRTFNWTIPGATMKLVGADVGRYERESWTESVPLAPAQRYIVDVRFPEAGHYAMMNQVQGIDHNVGAFFPEHDTLGVVRVTGAPAAPSYDKEYRVLRTNRDVVTEVAAYRSWIDRAPDREILLTLRLGELPFGLLQMLRRDVAYSHPVEWAGTMPMMDWLPTAKQVEWVLRDAKTGNENMAVDWKFRVGDLVKIRIGNDRSSLHPMSHPIHLHGQRFLILAHNDVPSTNLVWKDTALIPVGGTADLLVEMSNPGKWMMHCHIAEHMESGMMAVFEVK